MSDRKRNGEVERINSSDLEILEEILSKIVRELRTQELKPRVSDLLKALELKLKLKISESDKEKLWELINQIRGEELAGDSGKSRRRS